MAPVSPRAEPFASISMHNNATANNGPGARRDFAREDVCRAHPAPSALVWRQAPPSLAPACRQAPPARNPDAPPGLAAFGRRVERCSMGTARLVTSAQVVLAR